MRRATALLAVLPVLFAGCAAEPPAGDGRPDVLLVIVDTLRADRLGTYGFPLDTSPRIDRLAAESVVFERAVAASSATAPSHASIMTSRFVRRHSVGPSNGGTRLVDTPTLAGAFRDAGYRTGAFVGNMVLRRRLGLHAGFDDYDDELLEPEINRSRTYERVADETTARAKAWLAGDGGAPFFLWVHYQDPHGPYTPPRGAQGRFRVRGAPDEAPLPILSDDSGYGGIPRYQALPGKTRASEYESRYADEIHFADRWVGRLLDAARARSRARGRDTIVLLTADHGESFGENERWLVHHHTTTPENAHVPLLVHAPGVAPARVSGLVHHVDVMPTLLDLAGLPPPPGGDGLSLADALRGGPLPERFVYCDIGREVSAYDEGGFVRMLGAEGSWSPDAERRDPVWVRYRWRPGTPWSREPSGGALDPEIRRYLASAEPLTRAPRLDAQDLERLRALGYALD